MMPPSLRILMTADAVGGVWIYATALARTLCRQGFHVHLVTLGPEPRKDQLHGLHGIPGLDLTVTDLPLEWMDPEGRDVARSRARLAEIEQRIRPDIVHLNGYRDATGDWQAPALVVAHSCVASWWRACRQEDPSEPRWLTYMANVRAGLAAADRWVAPSAAFRDQVQELYCPPTTGCVIWNGLDRSVRATAKQPVILAAGRLWDEAKNIASLAAVAARMPARIAWPIRIAGPLTPSTTQTERETVGLACLGDLSRHDLMQEMRHASIFVAPAVYEPFGLAVLEAALAGCALVLSDIESFRELWDGAALFIDPRDPLMLQSVLAHLIRNEALRRDLQKRAALRARRYSLSAMADAYRELYRTLPRLRASTPAVVPRRFEEAWP
jgi:glycosyltransferase involved in cell wall biosynthesis